MKILFIHGYQQNAAIFRRKTATIRKQLAFAECVYAEAPHLVGDHEQDEERTLKGWWKAVEQDGKMRYTGAVESLEYLNRMWAAGDYCGILGFSQGAAMANIFSQQLDPKPQFLISVSGFAPRDESYALAQTDIPILHVIGDYDKIIVPQISMHLAQATSGQAFVPYETSSVAGSSTLLRHPHGHLLPGHAEYRKYLNEWILKQIEPKTHM